MAGESVGDNHRVNSVIVVLLMVRHFLNITVNIARKLDTLSTTIE